MYPNTGIGTMDMDAVQLQKCKWVCANEWVYDSQGVAYTEGLGVVASLEPPCVGLKTTVYD